MHGPSATTGSTTTSPKTLLVTRQHFLWEETESLVLGLLKEKVKIVETLTWDDSVLSSFFASSSGDDL